MDGLIQKLESRLLELEEQKRKIPAAAAGIDLVMEEIRSRLEAVRAGRPDPYA